MKDVILYGNVRDKSFKAVTEYYFTKEGYNILFYADDNVAPGQTGRTEGIDGLEKRDIYNPDVITQYPDALIIIMVSISYNTIISRLRNAGIENEIMMAPLLGWRFIIDDYIPPELLMSVIPDWIKVNKNELLRIYETDDWHTKNLLEEIMEERSRYAPVDYSKYKHLQVQSYFEDESLSPTGGVIFVDGGAYIGDSIAEMERVRKEKVVFSIGFEPDADNYRIAAESMYRLGIEGKVRLLNKGMYDRDGVLRFRKVGDEYSVDEDGDIETEVCRLDSNAGDIDKYLTTSRKEDTELCIKMDLEGSEVPALLGSSETIRKHHPYMAICLYHRMRDILDVPRTIMSIRDDYKFYLRAGVHTELYAVPQRQ